MNHPFGPVLEIEDRGQIRVVRLNRPEARNAVDESLHDAIVGMWEYLAADPDARAVVLTANGKAFSAGGDMGMLERLHADPGRVPAMMREAAKLVRNGLGFPLPVVTAVNGEAIGLGCSLAILGDVVLMADDAYFADTHVAVGLTAGDGGAPLWPALASSLRIREYLYTGERIAAELAVELGLATRVVPASDLLDEAIAVAERLAALPARALRSTKAAVNMHLSRASLGVIEYALEAESLCFADPEHVELVAKFRSARR